MSTGVPAQRAVGTATSANAWAPHLSIEGVAKSWRNQGPPLFAGVDLELEPGALAVVTGRNGVGKTTLLRIVAGLIFPDAGTVRLDGLAPTTTRREYHRLIGFLSAGSAGLYARLTVGQHLDYWGRLALLSPGELRSRADATCARFDLGDIVDRRADRLSMGQRQRVRLALAFLHEPSLLLLDEPANSLDGEGQSLLRGEVDAFVARGGIVLYSVPAGHDVDALPTDLAFVLENGGLERA